MGIEGYTPREETKNVSVDAPLSGSDFSGIARTNESGSLTDTSNIIEQQRFVYQNNFNDNLVHSYVNLEGKTLYITDILLSISNTTGATINGTLSFGMSDGAGNFDGLVIIPYSILNNDVVNFDHQFFVPLEFEKVLRSPVGGSVLYPWFSVYNSGGAVNINFCLNGWIEK